MHKSLDSSVPLTLQRAFQNWWPLAVSWLLMALELPAISATISRLPNATTNLAAYGGIVFPLYLLMDSPIVMLLSTSNALSKDWNSYLKLRRFMMLLGAFLMCIHSLVAFTPLYDVITKTLLGIPSAIADVARPGLMILTPLSWTIAYRRFNQGILIRYEQNRWITAGTLLRLSGNGSVLILGFLTGEISGVVVGTSASICGIMLEAIFIGWKVRPILRQLKGESAVEDLTYSDLFKFYIPLALTPMVTQLAQPLGSAAISRMLYPKTALALWPLLMGLLFVLRSAGLAHREVVVALIGRKDGEKILKRLTQILCASATTFLLFIAFTPLGSLWFGTLMGLSPSLQEKIIPALYLGTLFPAFNILVNWYQGILVKAKRTSGITVSVVIYLIVVATILEIGILYQDISGIYVGALAFTLGQGAQALWLRRLCKKLPTP